MAKPTKKEITRLLKQGWYFRIKTLKKYRYITARKNKDETSLGKYNDETWNLIQSLKGKKEKVELKQPAQVLADKNLYERQIKSEKFDDELEKYFNLTKIGSCLFRRSGYCVYWKFEKLPPFIQKYNEIIGNEYAKHIIDATGSEYWIIQAIGITCKNCPAFLDAKSLDLINEKLIFDPLKKS